MAEKPDEEVVSTQRRLQSSHDPGWNDPPKWAFTPSPASTGTPTKRLLNKRVAFPLSSAPASPGNPVAAGQQLPPGNLPPPPAQLTSLTSAPHAPLLAPTAVPNTSDIAPSIADKEEALHKTLENIQTVIDGELDRSRVEEVQKRLEVMRNMWSAGKLNDTIQGILLRISEALRDKDIDAADKLHVSLMMDHTSLCNTWISGIRHLILDLRAKNAGSDSKSESHSQSVFLLNPTDSTLT
ncbi:steroid receptor RNA activator 1 [Diachasma alloeum]|uniref:steroid receptor RNA activator 1 n=1 Tax=Diachasma alloeum TaxID=454923 RepID=UPI0007381539|nr:steroid receptor RNA activator 1 [Diachasma alloeum]